MARFTTTDEFNIRCGYGSDIGLHREINEDHLLVSETVFAVADGMGGHEAGEVASRLAIQNLEALADGYNGDINATALQEALEDADNNIHEVGAGRAGTTVTGAALIMENGQPYWLVFNVGDSRTYRLRDGKLELLTVDHSEVQDLINHGYITAEEARFHPRRHVITRALGAGAANQADFYLYPVIAGDRLLICSDGLSTELEDDEIHALLTTYPEAQTAVNELITHALARGGRDNVTVIVVDAVPNPNTAS
ncbi:PP2C family protein-serine/threonine phosphatase [Micrococcoides hystricis]|uniref:PP2C family protein-serine/threonine phosphatase n=1 Tax=Micrococcoides hystricis TaxID=1572761 RepID=A0ABV6PAC2_9MICC